MTTGVHASFRHGRGDCVRNVSARSMLFKLLAQLVGSVLLVCLLLAAGVAGLACA